MILYSLSVSGKKRHFLVDVTLLVAVALKDYIAASAAVSHRSAAEI